MNSYCYSSSMNYEPIWRRNYLPHWKRFKQEYKFPLERNTSLPILQDQETVSCIWDASIVLSKYMLNTNVFPKGNLFHFATVYRSFFAQNCPGTRKWLWIIRHNFFVSWCYNNSNRSWGCIPILKENVARAALQLDLHNIQVQELLWGTDINNLQTSNGNQYAFCSRKTYTHLFSHEHHFDYILGADIIYEIQHFDDLIQTLRDVTDPSTIILMAYPAIFSITFPWC